MSGIVIGGTGSGAGKTTVTLAVMAALARRGVKVAGFKVGPDFIDPAFHAVASGRVSRNLDGWILSPEANRKVYERGMAGAAIGIVEGVMGLFDGAGSGERGSTGEIAKELGLPSVLVVDAKGASRSVAAVVSGFEQFDPDLRIAGVIFNRVGSDRHALLLSDVLLRHCRAVPAGFLPRDERFALPERHLGLVQACEQELATLLDLLARQAEKTIDLDLLLKLADGSGSGLRAGETQDPAFLREAANPPLKARRSLTARLRLAVARDAAFSFYYQDNLDLLQEAGAEILFFSPLSDPHLPPCDAIYLPGGYPELHAERLASNSSLRAEIRLAARAGLPIYAECGGLIYLCREIESGNKKRYPMVGLFPSTARMLPRRKALGYREVELAADGPLGPAGSRIRGHEYHYSELDPPPTPSAYRVFPAGEGEGKPEGYRYKNVLASYVHLHFGSHPKVAENFIRSCLSLGGRL